MIKYYDMAGEHVYTDQEGQVRPVVGESKTVTLDDGSSATLVIKDVISASDAHHSANVEIEETPA